MVDTDDEADYHTKKERQLRPTNSLTSLPRTVTIEDDLDKWTISDRYLSGMFFQLVHGCNVKTNAWRDECIGRRVRREERYRGSKWEPNWMKGHGGGQTDQDEILDDCCHMTSASRTLCLSYYYTPDVLILIFALIKYMEKDL